MTDQIGLFNSANSSKSDGSTARSSKPPAVPAHKPASDTVVQPQDSSGTALRSSLIGQKWKDLLKQELEADYYLNLKNYIKSERAAGKIIYPQDSEIFSSLHYTPLDQVKVVILGQDPYHGPGQAHGLCFSVKPGVPPPPSLENIFKEINQDLKIPRPQHGHLVKWAKQGVLLLNAVLSVEASKAGSHANRGWERFTDKIVSIVNEQRSGVVFMLWGSYAQKKGAIIDRTRHHVLIAPHPSPLSAHRGFLGCKHFSEANRLLELQGQSPIDWSL